MNFMNLPKEFSTKEKSKIQIIPISFESNVTVGSGASRGPEKILKASKELEYFDEELKVEPYSQGIFTTKINKLKKEKNFNKTLQDILDTLTPLLDNKFPIILGSDHSTTIGVIKAFEKKYNDFGIIVFDAHSDLREPWGEETWWHACTSRLISKNHSTLITGVRSQDFYEHEFVNSREGKNVSIIYAHELLSSKTAFEYALKKLPKNIFFSIDVDFLDPSIIRNTNTPEPGGFLWNNLNNLLLKIFKRKKVIGVDITEFAPNGPEWNYKSEAYLLAKLVYKICAYKQAIKRL